MKIRQCVEEHCVLGGSILKADRNIFFFLEQNAASVLREKTLSQDAMLTNLIMCAVSLGEGLQS
jgi:flagellar biosynthesis regulator FlbT